MESNKEDAEKCIRIAQKAISDGDQPKAVKFLKRSLRLYPSTKAEGELFKLKRNISNCTIVSLYQCIVPYWYFFIYTYCTTYC